MSTAEASSQDKSESPGCAPMRVARTVRIVGVVDPLGYLKCASCVDVTAYESGYVWDDSAPHNREACDICRRALVADVPVRDLKRGDNVRVAGSVWTITQDPYFYLGYVHCALDAGYGRTGRYHFRADTTIPVCA